MSRAALPTPRTLLGAAAAGGLVYAVGGSNGSELAIVEVYDPTADRWTTGPALATGRMLAGVAARSDGHIYAIGGYSDTLGPLVSVEDLPPGGAWEPRFELPTSRFGLGAAVVGTTVYAVGGWNDGPLAELLAGVETAGVVATPIGSAPTATPLPQGTPVVPGALGNPAFLPIVANAGTVN